MTQEGKFIKKKGQFIKKLKKKVNLLKKLKKLRIGNFTGKIRGRLSVSSI
jgi:hypothetical protein